MTTKKTLLLVFVLLIFLGTITSLAQLQMSAPNDQRNKQKEEPTVLKDDTRSIRQIEHGKLFKHAGRRLQDIAASRPGDVEVVEEEGYVIQMPNSTRAIPTFRSALCNADAVVLGTLKDKSSQLTAQGNFIFTDYEMVVDEVIKNNISSPIAVASTIVTTRDGGAIEVNRRILRAKRADFDPPVVGNRYLLFLRFIPNTSSYLMYGNGSFELQDKAVFALGPESRQELKHRGNQDSLIFLNELRAFASDDCPKN